MSAFEFSFGLLSLLLGLGFAHLADAFARLVLAGRRVRWDWLPPLVALNAFQAGLIYWWFQWSLRDQPVMLSDLASRCVACLSVYVFAIGALPTDTGGAMDMREHFERSRRLTYGAFITYIVLVAYVLPWSAGRGYDRGWETPTELAFLAACLFVRDRRLNGAVQLGTLLVTAAFWMGQSIAG